MNEEVRKGNSLKRENETEKKCFTSAPLVVKSLQAVKIPLQQKGFSGRESAAFKACLLTMTTEEEASAKKKIFAFIKNKNKMKNSKFFFMKKGWFESFVIKSFLSFFI